MQLCNCTVHLGGSLLNTVKRSNVTVAEIVVLRAIHGGEDTVVDIQPTNMDKRPHADEFERLSNNYSKRLLKDLFPGANPKLPVDLADIGVTREAAPSEPTGMSPQQKAAATRAAKAAAEAEAAAAGTGGDDAGDNDE